MGFFNFKLQCMFWSKCSKCKPHWINVRLVLKKSTCFINNLWCTNCSVIHTTPVEIDKRNFFSLWRAARRNLQKKNNMVLKEVFEENSIDPDIMPEVAVEAKIYSQLMCDTLSKLWAKHNRTTSLVLRFHRDLFLDKTFKLPWNILDLLPSMSLGGWLGRKLYSFEKCSESTKPKNTAAMRNENQTAELVLATQAKLHESGQAHAANILKEPTQTTPSMALRMPQSYRKALSMWDF